MSARASSNTASKPSQDSSSSAVDGTQQPKALSPSNELTLESDTQFSNYFSFDNGLFESREALPFLNNSPFATPSLAQDWDHWLDIGNNGDVFDPVITNKKTASYSESAPGSFVPTFSREEVTPDSSPASLDAVAEISNEQPSSTAENSEQPSYKSLKLRSHEIVHETPPVLDDVTSQITSRLGRLQVAGDGQPRYYGATSNLHLLHSGPRSLVQPNIRHVVTHGDAAISQAGLQWNGDPTYENLLISLFFSWHNALMYVVDKTIFLREREQFHLGKITDHYSPALENAVYVPCEKH